MQFIQTYIQRISTHLQMQGFLFEKPPALNGTDALLYARSRRPYPVAFSRVSDHFLFLDWEEHLSFSKERLIDTYNAFNRVVNQSFHVPNVFRFTIPGIALVVLSNEGFDAQTMELAQNTYLVPFKGGEVGQFLLVDMVKREVIFHRGHVYKQPGEAPLRAAQYVLVPILEDCLRPDYVLPWKRPAGESFPVNPYR